jgi:hypothetical protein
MYLGIQTRAHCRSISGTSVADPDPGNIPDPQHCPGHLFPLSSFRSPDAGGKNNNNNKSHLLKLFILGHPPLSVHLLALQLSVHHLLQSISQSLLANIFDLTQKSLLSLFDLHGLPDILEGAALPGLHWSSAIA